MKVVDSLVPAAAQAVAPPSTDGIAPTLALGMLEAGRLPDLQGKAGPPKPWSHNEDDEPMMDENGMNMQEFEVCKPEAGATRRLSVDAETSGKPPDGNASAQTFCIKLRSQQALWAGSS